MGAITSAVIAIAGVVLGWITIEIACKPCLEKGREAIDRNLDPNYDADDADIRTPLHSNPNPTSDLDVSKLSYVSSTSPDPIKAVSN